MRVFRKRKPYNDGDPPLPDIVYQMAAEQAARFVATNPPLQNSYAGYSMNGQDGLYNMPYVPAVPIPNNNEVLGEEIGAPNRSGSPLNFVRSVFRRGRTGDRGQPSTVSRLGFNRASSPDHFRQRPGSPQLTRSRPGSPFHLTRSRPGSPFQFDQQERSSSPFHFGQTAQTSAPLTYHYVPEDRSSSPHHFIPPTRSTPADVQRRLAVAQLSQDLQREERQQRLQQATIMSYPTNFMPQFQAGQQPYYSLVNSSVNTQGYPTLTQPQMYTYY